MDDNEKRPIEGEGAGDALGEPDIGDKYGGGEPGDSVGGGKDVEDSVLDIVTEDLHLDR